jgi:hypothetical protein
VFIPQNLEKMIVVYCVDRNGPRPAASNIAAERAGIKHDSDRGYQTRATSGSLYRSGRELRLERLLGGFLKFQ